MNIRKIIRAALWIVLPLFILFFSLFTTIDRDRDAVNALITQAEDSIRSSTLFTGDGDTVSFAFGSVDITPAKPLPMAGYSPRDSYDSIHDPINIKILLINQGAMSVYVVSADLLLFPAILADKIKARLGPSEHVYFSATHSHSSLGGWDASFGGQLALGDFDVEYWESVAQKVEREMMLIYSGLQPGTISYFEAPAPFVKNRLSPEGSVDSNIRGVKFKRSEGDSALLITYAGHPTLVERDKRILSADYPGMLNTKLESDGYAFTMFLAGMMGSHSITGIPGKNFDRIDALADSLHTRIPNSSLSDSIQTMSFMRVNLPFRKSQLRISESLALRNWVYNRILTPLEGHLSVLRLGHVVLVSTSCDFSGEIWAKNAISAPSGSHVIITSFNGDYVGYITADEHYNGTSHAEVRTMNWVGPYFGEYFSQVITKALEKVEP